MGRQETYVLQVQGDSMIDEQIRDGDYVIVENRTEARDGEMVIALLDGDERDPQEALPRRGAGCVCNRPTPRWRPSSSTRRSVRIQGVVIGVLRKY